MSILTDPSTTQTYFERIRQRVIYFCIATALQWAARKWPSLPLPPLDDIAGWVLAMLGSHGLGDVIKLAKEYIQDRLKKAK
jgi:hypothetical protein